MSTHGESDGPRLAGIPPGGTNHCLKLGPLRRIKVLVAPLLEF
jgi:hypothetical protein